MGFFGALAVFTANALGLTIWVLFLAWIAYYLFGANIKKMPVIALQMALGIALGIILQTLAGFATAAVGPLGYPLVVFFIIGGLSLVTKIKNLNSIPSWFLGLIIFFGVHPPMEFLPIVSLLIPIVAGILFAWANHSTDEWILNKESKELISK